MVLAAEITAVDRVTEEEDNISDSLIREVADFFSAASRFFIVSEISSLFRNPLRRESDSKLTFIIEFLRFR